MLLVHLSRACHAAKTEHRLLLLTLIAASVTRSEQLSVCSRWEVLLPSSTLSRKPPISLVPQRRRRSMASVLLDGADVGSRASDNAGQGSNGPHDSQKSQFSSRLEGMDSLAQSWAEDLGLSSVEELENWVEAFEAPDSDEVEYQRGVKRESKQQAARRARKKRRQND